ncbi:DUF3141 domain-containing protein [Sphingobium sp. MK2]|nr:poly(3-hydroxyalkanoate) synthetase [Sphingobium sp. Ant17]
MSLMPVAAFPPAAAPGPTSEADSPSVSVLGQILAYQRDAWERSILFCDVLRQRANNMLEHERLGLPPLLKFTFETMLDARRFDQPANYALLRITEIDDACADDCIDRDKPPVVILDPRAGHGPGIGGFKRESEIGMALKEGHPVYFVTFFPEPCEGQTLADVLHALRRFVEAVSGRHPGKPPVLYGNCQAGWAVTLLSADCEGTVGPAVLNGSPLSYWSGESGINPMRLMGGLLGGAWLAEFTADIGDRRFDGAWLAMNFENLNPGNALWDKYTALYADVDTEAARFLDFERWWNGFYSLSHDEIAAIVENLFIGNQIERGVFQICGGCTADLRRIRNPLVIFASYGDNITPPHQALGWIPAVYASTAELKAAGQRIVYLTNPHVGHLGIFVSAGVAKLEHRAILESLDEITALEPGLYEMKIDNPAGEADCHRPQFGVRFEPRLVEELHFPKSANAFEKVREISEINLGLYRTVLAPWIQASANPWSATMLKWLHPMRTSRYLLSEEFAPWMRFFATLAPEISANRHPAPADNPFLKREQRLIGDVSDAFKIYRSRRDLAAEDMFAGIYGPA